MAGQAQRASQGGAEPFKALQAAPGWCLLLDMHQQHWQVCRSCITKTGLSSLRNTADVPAHDSPAAAPWEHTGRRAELCPEILNAF